MWLPGTQRGLRYSLLPWSSLASVPATCISLVTADKGGDWENENQPMYERSGLVTSKDLEGA